MVTEENKRRREWLAFGNFTETNKIRTLAAMLTGKVWKSMYVNAQVKLRTNKICAIDIVSGIREEIDGGIRYFLHRTPSS